MRAALVRILFVALAGAVLTGCNATMMSGLDKPAVSEQGDGTQAMAQAPETPTAGAAASPQSGLLGSNPEDDLSLGKKYYRASDFGLAEKHFRRAVEVHATDAEGWLGLAASYDQLRRFDLADRAYAQAIRLTGTTVEIINNQGYSYMLRGEYRKAAAKLAEAAKKAPENPYVKNNIRLLAESTHQHKSIE